MWQRACPLLTAGLAVGLVLARRRLTDAGSPLPPGAPAILSPLAALFPPTAAIAAPPHWTSRTSVSPHSAACRTPQRQLNTTFGRFGPV
jgi:hypothetical protein